MRERERERERQSARVIAIAPDLATESRSPSHRIVIAPDRDRTGSRNQIEIAIAPDLVTRSRSRLHRIENVVYAISRRLRSRLHEIAIDGAVWVVACVFLNLCFPSSFPNTRKYFPENFLKCNQTPWKHFPFPKISISEKYVFSGRRFTATKHSPKKINFIMKSVCHFNFTKKKKKKKDTF